MENSNLKEMIKNYCLENRIDPSMYLTDNFFNVDEFIKDVQLKTN